MDEIELQVNKREILGKKVRFLRRQGIIPVHVFGHGIKSLALQCDTATLKRGLAQAGHTGIISLTLDTEKSPRHVIVREIQREVITGELLHVDFYEVKMGEKVNVEIPVVIVGEAPALKLKDTMLVQELNTLTIECLPAKIPTSVRLDISSLTELEQTVQVKDIELDKEITVFHDPELVVVKIGARPVEKVEEAVPAEKEMEEAVAAETPEAEPN